VPVIKNISISNANNGILLSWNIELLDGFEKRVYIQRGSTSSSFKFVGETDQDRFMDYYVDVGIAYYYYIQINEHKYSMNDEYTSFSTTSGILTSPVSVTGRGEINAVSNIVLKSGGGKIDLSWDAIPNNIDTGYIITYEIRRRKYENGQIIYSYSLTTMNTNYSDSDFVDGNSVDDTYYYTIIPVIISNDSDIKYYGLESDPVSGIPSVSVP
jgi:hypothetical protein